MRDHPLLMIPGPTEIPWRVIQAMARPSISHHDPRFNVDVLDATLLKLREVFRTQSEIIPVPGSGRVALEAPIQSAIEPGDKVLTIVNGVFGAWMTEMVQRLGATAIELTVPLGKQIDLAVLESTLEGDDFTAVTVVHSETSTGVLLDLSAIAEVVKKHDLLLFVDTVSSLGGVDVNTDGWQLDFSMTGSQKCLHAPLGLAMTSISEAGWQKMATRETPPRVFSWDLYRWKTMWLPPERGGELQYGFRRQPISMPVHAVYALAEAVDMVLEEGLPRRFERHARMAAAFRAGAGAMGLHIVAEPGAESPTVSCVRLPEGIAAKDVTTRMEAEHNVQIAGGMGDLKDTTVRVGHMGLTAAKEYLLPTLIGLSGTLASLGATAAAADAAAAFLEVADEGPPNTTPRVARGVD